MTFNEIMPLFLNGAKIRRTSWNESLWIEARHDAEQIRLFRNEEGGKRLITIDERFSLSDVTANDWVCYEE